MKLYRADDPAALPMAKAALRRPGAVLLLPTETVYGLVCRADDESARRRIFELKSRAGSKPLGWFVADWRMAERRGAILTPAARAAAERHMPGALTMIVRREGGGTVGFRVPDHPLLAALLRGIGEPLAQTSANRSGAPDARDCREALAGLAGEVDLAVDAGELAPGACASTVVDFSGETPKILRQGAVRLDLGGGGRGTEKCE